MRKDLKRIGMAVKRCNGMSLLQKNKNDCRQARRTATCKWKLEDLKRPFFNIPLFTRGTGSEL